MPKTSSISTAVWLEFGLVTDRRTDRRTQGNSHMRAGVMPSYLAKASNHCLYHLLPPQRPLHNALRVRGYQFQLPNCIYKFHKKSFILSSLFRFLKYFFSGLVFPYFSLLCDDVNCDFVLILISYCSTTYYYVLFHWRCMYV